MSGRRRDYGSTQFVVRCLLQVPQRPPQVQRHRLLQQQRLPHHLCHDRPNFRVSTQDRAGSLCDRADRIPDRLPHNLTQRSRRMSSDTGASKPASRKRRTSSIRPVLFPASSPKANFLLVRDFELHPATARYSSHRRHTRAHVRSRDPTRRAPRIHGVQMPFRPIARNAVKVPKGNTIDHRNNRRLGAKKRRDLIDGTWNAVRLSTNEHQILFAE